MLPSRRSSLDKLKLQREVDGLRTTICCPKREIGFKPEKPVYRPASIEPCNHDPAD
jgi:hypothetical protein